MAEAGLTGFSIGIKKGDRPGLYVAVIKFVLNDNVCSCRAEVRCVSIDGSTCVELYVSSLGDEVLTIPDEVQRMLENLVL